MHDAADDPSSMQAYNNLSFSCQMPILPRYKKITLTVAGLFTG